MKDSDGKSNVGAGGSTLMSTSDGLRAYILRRKMEGTRPMGEKGWKSICLSPESAFKL